MSPTAAMKRALRIVIVLVFVVFGGAYVFLAPIMADQVGHWTRFDKVLRHFENNIPSVPSADEDDRFLGLYTMMGVSLFAPLWGWVGWSISRNWRLGAMRGLGVMAGTIAGVAINFATVAIFFSRQANPFAITAVYMMELGAASWLCAWAAGRLVGRNSSFIQGGPRGCRCGI